MKVTLGLLLAIMAIGTEAASMHRRHDQFHKRHTTEGRRYDLLEAAELQKRGGEGYSGYAEATPEPAYGKEQKPSKPTKCKRVATGQWVPAEKKETTPVGPVIPPIKEYKAPEPAPPSPKEEHKAPEPVPQPAPPKPSKEGHKTEPEPEPKASPKQSGSYGTSGDKPYGITYSALRKGGCATEQEMKDDVAAIAKKGFQTIRIYASECDNLKIMGDACKKNNIKLIVGTFIKDEGFDKSKEDLEAILAWKDWAVVDMVVIGNEAIFGHKKNAGELSKHVNEARDKLRKAGCNAPVTTAEITGTLEQFPELCDCMDVVGLNVHPYFNKAEVPSNAGKFLKGQVDVAKNSCPGKEVYVLEAGWPTKGNPNGAAHPGTEEQRVAVEAMKSMDDKKCVYFSYNDEDWKDENEFNIERHFGLGNLFSDVGGAIKDTIDNAKDKVKDTMGNVKDDIKDALNPGH